MDLETIYEIRTVIGGRVARRIFVNSPHELYAEFKSIDPSTKSYIFKTLRDENGEIIVSNKLDCKVHKNSFIVKTIFGKPKRVFKDSKRIEFLHVHEKQPKQVYDIAFLEKPTIAKRTLPFFPPAQSGAGRLKKSPSLLSPVQASRYIADLTFVDPILRTTPRISKETYRGNIPPKIYKETYRGDASPKTSGIARHTSINIPAEQRVRDFVTTPIQETSARNKSKTIFRVPKNNLRAGSPSRTDKSRRRI